MADRGERLELTATVPAGHDAPRSLLPDGTAQLLSPGRHELDRRVRPRGGMSTTA